ncbi:MAG TPA: hypothetical protein VHR47_01020 [Bacillota bacterium]|nr:hypothetical protein [Bacillota bacterium]
MKKFIIILVAVLLMSLIQISAVCAAVHPRSKSIQNQWFTVDEEETPYVEGLVSKNDDDDWTWFGQYYDNDQTYFNFNCNDSNTGMSGSYLWNNGFFLGLEYGDFNNGDDSGDSWGIHPGYRWNLDRGYIAFSIDYDKRNEDGRRFNKRDTEQKGLELNYVYYPENLKINTDLILAKSNTSATFDRGNEVSELKQLLFDQTLNYKIAENLVLGFGLTYNRRQGEFSYSDNNGYHRLTDEEYSTVYSGFTGFTWEPKYFILNGAILAAHTKGSETAKEYDFRLVIPFCQQFELGIDYSNQSYRDMNDENKNISFQYNIKEDSALRLSYDTTVEIWSLLYHRDM